MNRSHLGAAALACLLATAAATADPLPILPSSSRERAERVRHWRESLDRARAADEATRTDEARALYRTVLDEAGPDAGGLLVARAADGLADVERRAGRPEIAVPLYERSVTLWRTLLGPGQPRLATSLHNLAACRAAIGDRQGAADAAREALTIWESWNEGGSVEAEATRRLLRVAELSESR